MWFACRAAASFPSIARECSQSSNRLFIHFFKKKKKENVAFAVEWIMQMCTYRTVSMAHERNETFPMDSTRFPSKSLHTHTHTHSATQLESIQYIHQNTSHDGKTAFDLFQVGLTASSVWASLCRCHPGSSKSCSAKPCQPGKAQFPPPPSVTETFSLTSVNLYKRSLR